MDCECCDATLDDRGPQIGPTHTRVEYVCPDCGRAGYELYRVGGTEPFKRWGAALTGHSPAHQPDPVGQPVRADGGQP